MLAGIAIGAVAIQGLHAQAKPKAYTVTELQTLDAKAAAMLQSDSGSQTSKAVVFPHGRRKSCWHGGASPTPASGNHGMG